MAADRGYPSALVQNPANIWQHQKNKFSFLYRKTDKELGAKYFNGFYSKRSNYFNKVTFALGFIQYDISKLNVMMNRLTS